MIEILQNSLQMTAFSPNQNAIQAKVFSTGKNFDDPLIELSCL